MNLSEEIKLGPLKSIEDITIDDMKKYPIWVNDGSDESSERSVINCNDVDEKIISKFFSIAILIYCEELDLYGSAYMEEDYTINLLILWKDNEWQENNDFIKYRNPLKIKCIPDIKGKKNVEYTFDITIDKGHPIAVS